MNVHPEFERHGSFAHLCLGKLPARHDDRTLATAAYLRDTLPAPPASLDLAGPVGGWPMYNNDKQGDCTCAAVGHMIECWTANAGRQVTPATSTIEHFYIPVTGTADTGRNELDVLNTWRKVGVGGDFLAGYTAVNVANPLEVRQGAWLFGGLYIGVQLPLTAQGQPVWDLVPDGGNEALPGSWGGHAIDVVGYDQEGVTVVTWGALQRMTWAFWAAYVDEAYCLVSRDFLKRDGETPEGLDLEQLQADLAAI